MKRRGWRVALTVATLGLALVASLVAFNWAAVRDHAEAWWFQATTETKKVEVMRPRAVESTIDPDDEGLPLGFLEGLSDHTGLPVVFAAAKVESMADSRLRIRVRTRFRRDTALAILSENGYRILEQYFPRRAYVVTGYPEPVYNETLLPPGVDAIEMEASVSGGQKARLFGF
jgi:hypothetical protein